MKCAHSSTNASNQKFPWSQFLKSKSKSEWLDLMLEEIEGKKRESEVAKDESERRSGVKIKPEQQIEKKSDGS